MHRSAVVCFIMALALLVGCQKEQPLPQHQGSTSPPPTDTGTVRTIETATTAPPPVQPAGAPPVSAAVSGTIIGSTDGEVPGVHIDITELKRTSGGTLNLKYVMTNNSGDVRGFGGHWLGDSSLKDDYYGTGGVHLVDPVNKKKYFVVRDAENVCMCSRELSGIQPGQKANLWAKFPAPPPDVQRITVVIPHFTPVDDVPIQ